MSEPLNAGVRVVLPEPAPTAAEQAPAPPPSPQELLARQFAGRKADLRPVYDALVHVAGRLGKVKVTPKPGCVWFEARRPFAVVRVKKDAVELGLTLGDAPARGRLLACRGLGGVEEITHKVSLPGLLAVNADVVLWVKRALQASAKRPQATRP